MSYYEDLVAKDIKYIWHPDTQMKDLEKHPPIIIKKGKGIYVWDIKGKKYIDGISSWWVNTLGHSNAKLNRALFEQAKKLEHVLFAGYSHEPAIELAERMVKASAEPLTKVFFSDNGSTAMEVALKMAFQYQMQRGKPNKQKFVTLKNSYHGDTLGSVSLGGVDIFYKLFKPLLFDVFQADAPNCYRCPLGKERGCCNIECISYVEKIFEQHSDKIAGMVIEPLVQGAGGMVMYPAEYIKKLRKLCDDYDILLIDDEVAMGFGRTGKLFAYEHAGISPDISAHSKGITAGYMPLAVTMATDEIFNAFYDDYSTVKTFYHGHSYTGNPLACAIAVENLKIFEKEKIIDKIQPKIIKLGKEIKKFEELDFVGDVRQTGMVAAIELVKDKNTKERFDFTKRIGFKICNEAVNNGLILRPIGDVLYFMPPYVINEKEIEKITNITYNAIKEITKCV